jgi:hypothetical protein
MSPQEESQKRMEALEMIASYAKDIVEAWPSTTMRTLGQMTQRVNSLRQALEAAENK